MSNLRRSIYEQTGPRVTFALLLTLAIAFSGAALFFPTAATLRFVAHTRSNADLRSTSEYLLFFTHLRRLLRATAFILAAVAVLALRIRTVYACVALRKVYYGFAIVLLVFFLSTPYSLIDPRRFVYDLGALLRNNIAVSSDHAQWMNYEHWLIGGKSWVLLVVGLTGVAVIAVEASPHLVLVGTYALIYLYVIGSSHLGFARYLTPILPYYIAASVLLSSDYGGTTWDGQGGQQQA